MKGKKLEKRLYRMEEKMDFLRIELEEYYGVTVRKNRRIRINGKRIVAGVLIASAVYELVAITYLLIH